MILLDDFDHDYNINVPFESSRNENSTQSAILKTQLLEF